MPRTTEIRLSACSITLPSVADMAICGSSIDSLLPMSEAKPLNTDSTHTSAAVVTTTPHIDMMEMMLTALCVFFATR